MNIRRYCDPISFIEKSDTSNERLIVNQNYRDLLSDIGFTTFDSVWSYECGELIKQKEERSVIRIKFPLKRKYIINDCVTADGDTGFYLKKHRQKMDFGGKLKRIIRPEFSSAEGYGEFSNYCNFRIKGLGTAEPVAAGVKYSSFSQVDSFLITQDFSPLTDLEDIILNHPEELDGEKNSTKKRNILREIAVYARKMHESGLNHKDFNATHILLDNTETEKPDVALFDLQRVDKNRLNRWRWPVKSLAELNFTLLPSIFSEEDRLFLFKAYKNIKQISGINRLLYLWIARKTARIARHCRKRGLAPKMPKTD